MSIKIRIAQASDLDDILDLHESSFREIGVRKESSRENFELNLSTTAVATEGSRVIGYLQWSITGKYTYMTWMAVAPQEQGKGAGKQLLSFAFSDLKKQGCSEVMLDSRNRFRSALGLYLKSGFDIVGTFLQEDGELMIRFRHSFDA